MPKAPPEQDEVNTPFRAIASSRFSRKMMILRACVRLVIGALVIGWHEDPWAAVSLVAVSVVALHPLMDQDLPTPDRAWPCSVTYIAVALNIMLHWFWLRRIKAFLGSPLEREMNVAENWR